MAQGTVSRALNDYADISDETKLRVREAADALGYRPNRAARALAKGVPEAIGYVLPGGHDAISEPFLGQLLQGIGRSAAERGWDMVVSAPETRDQELALIDQLARSGRVGGIVLSRTLSDDPRIAILQRSGLAFVVHGRTRDCSDYAWYDVDGELAAMDAVRHLVSLGHTRIGMIAGPEPYNFARLRREGFEAAIREQLGVEPDPHRIVVSELDPASGERAAAHVLAHGATAIFCVTDMVAIGALSALAKRGLEPGRDVSVIGYDGIAFGEHTAPPLTTMAQPKVRAGHRIGEMLLALIDGADPRSLHELHRARLVRRQTDGPPSMR